MSSTGGYCSNKTIKLISLLLQLLYQRFYGSLGERFTLPSLPMTHQTVHDAQTCVRRRGGLWHNRHCFRVFFVNRLVKVYISFCCSLILKNETFFKVKTCQLCHMFQHFTWYMMVIISPNSFKFNIQLSSICIIWSLASPSYNVFNVDTIIQNSNFLISPLKHTVFNISNTHDPICMHTN